MDHTEQKYQAAERNLIDNSDIGVIKTQFKTTILTMFKENNSTTNWQEGGQKNMLKCSIIMQSAKSKLRTTP